MIKLFASHCLCFLLVICIYIEHNDAATKVLYEFHIQEKHSERNETGSLNDSSSSKEQPELVITGKRTSSFVIPAKDANSTNSIYIETAVYTADDSGYHVNYNISIEPLEIDPRLHQKTLMVLTG